MEISIQEHYRNNPVSEEFKERMREINIGRVHSEEWNINNSMAQIKWNKEHPDAHRGNNNPMCGKHPSKKCIEVLKSKRGKDSARSRSVLQYDLDNQFIKRWDSIADAAQYYSGKRDASHISACARGKRKVVYGYIWKYE